MRIRLAEFFAARQARAQRVARQDRDQGRVVRGSCSSHSNMCFNRRRYMTKRNFLYVAVCMVLCVAVTAFAQRGRAEPQRPDNPQSLVHVDAAKKLAGNDEFLAKPMDFFC